MKKYGAFLFIAGVLLVAIVAAAMFMRSQEGRDISSNAEPQPESSPALRRMITLEEFGDYQCAPCAQLHPTLKDLKKAHGTNLNFVFRNLPLPSIHKNSLPAAQAAEAARMQNRFWEMHDLLYENQALWVQLKSPKPQFFKFAAEIGLDLIQFETDMAGDQVRFRLEADYDAAVRLGIDSTPTIVINGRKLRPEATNADGIRQGIEVTGSRQTGGSAVASPSVP